MQFASGTDSDGADGQNARCRPRAPSLTSDVQAAADLTRDRHSDSYAKADCKACEQLAGQIQGEGTE
jgi:hypothetical protein